MPVLSDGRVVQHRFDPAPHPLRGVGFLVPDRFEHSHHMICVDCIHRQFADDRRSISFQCGFPLLGMDRISPAWSVCRDVGFGDFIEGRYWLDRGSLRAGFDCAAQSGRCRLQLTPDIPLRVA